MDISQVAKRSGIAASTLRYYEKKGLIQSVARHGLKRVFPTNIMQQLALISLGQSAGFSLDEIRQMLGPNGQPEIDREKLRQKAKEIDDTIARLSSMRDGLLHAAECKATTHLQCPKFLKILGKSFDSRKIK